MVINTPKSLFEAAPDRHPYVRAKRKIRRHNFATLVISFFNDVNINHAMKKETKFKI